MGTIALLAMAPSGETYMVRDEMGRLWLMQPPGAGDPRVIEPDVVDLAVAKHGFDRIDQDFASWSDLDHFRQVRAASAAPPLPVEKRPLDLDDVERLFRVVRRWADQGQIPGARRAAFTLLAAPVVRADADQSAGRRRSPDRGRAGEGGGGADQPSPPPEPLTGPTRPSPPC